MAHTKEYSIYPGEYTLMPETEALMEELKASNNSLGVQPLVNMKELDDCFEIEMIIPGVKREDLFIHVNNNALSIVVLHKHCELKRKLQIHELDDICIERHILLPLNADTEFTSAEYNQGILCMHIPKYEHPFQSGVVKQIVVY